jgi:hypothetical protein
MDLTLGNPTPELGSHMIGSHLNHSRVIVDVHHPNATIERGSGGGDAFNDALYHYTSMASRQRGVDVLLRFQASGEWGVTDRVRGITMLCCDVYIYICVCVCVCVRV